MHKNAGCQVQRDLDQTTLNFGLHLSNQDHFKEASKVLELFASSEEKGQSQLNQDAYRLWRYCSQQSHRVAPP